MKPTQQLHDLGQSLWLDNITRTMLDDGTCSDTSTSSRSQGRRRTRRSSTRRSAAATAYDERSRSCVRRAGRARSSSSSWRWPTSRARPRCSGRSTSETDGWTAGSPSRSRRCSPTTPRRRSRQAKELHAPRGAPNNFIKIPGTPEGLPAIEESIFAGVPVNVTLLFSREQYVAAAEAYMRGIERRVDAGLDPDVPRCFAVHQPLGRRGPRTRCPTSCRTGSGSPSARRPTRRTASCWTRDALAGAANTGARPQRLLLASTGTKDPEASDTLYIKAFAAPDTINTMPEGPSKPSPTTARSAIRCPPTAATARRSSRRSRTPASTPTRRPSKLQKDGAERSSSPGTSCSRRSSQSRRGWRRRTRGKCNESCRVERPGLRACPAVGIM